MPPDNDAAAGGKRARPERGETRPAATSATGPRSLRARLSDAASAASQNVLTSLVPPADDAGTASRHPCIDLDRLRRQLLTAFKAKPALKTSKSSQAARSGLSVVDHIHDYIVSVCERYPVSGAMVPSHEDLLAEGTDIIRKRLNATKQSEIDREQIVKREAEVRPRTLSEVAEGLGSGEVFDQFLLALYGALASDQRATDLLNLIVDSDIEPHENQKFAAVLDCLPVDIANKKRKIARKAHKIIAKPPFNTIYRRPTEL